MTKQIFASLFMICMVFSVNAMKKTSYYIQPPQDEYWNTGYSTTIIEAENTSSEDDRFASLKVIAPKSFKEKWPSVCLLYFIECKGEGPARELKWKEYVSVIRRLMPKRKLPKGYSESDFE